MKYLLVAAALTLGFCGTCFAQTPMSNSMSKMSNSMSKMSNSMSKMGEASMSAPVLGKGTSPTNKCHIEGQQLVCE